MDESVIIGTSRYLGVSSRALVHLGRKSTPLPIRYLDEYSSPRFLVYFTGVSCFASTESVMGAVDQVRDVLLVMSHPSHTTGVNHKCGSRARICTHDAVGIDEP